MMRKTSKSIPFILTIAVVLADQLTKWLIAEHIPVGGVAASFAGGLVRIVHARNTAIAFSIGEAMPAQLKAVLFSAVPLIVLGAIAVYVIRSNALTPLQRWAACGIIGGGAGNLVDRIFRPAGVVDFIDVEFFGIFGLDRWPTFNVADMAIVICGILLLLAFLFQKSPADSAP